MSVNIRSFRISPFPFAHFLSFHRTYVWFSVSATFSLAASGQNWDFGTKIHVLEVMGQEESVFWPLAYEFGACSFHTFTLCVISGFRSEVAKTCALLDYYAACSRNYLETGNSGWVIIQKRAVFTFTHWFLNVFLFVFVFHEETEESERFWYLWRTVEQLGLVLASHVVCKNLNLAADEVYPVYIPYLL
jgi:hypothetical protein